MIRSPRRHGRACQGAVSIGTCGERAPATRSLTSCRQAVSREEATRRGRAVRGGCRVAGGDPRVWAVSDVRRCSPALVSTDRFPPARSPRRPVDMARSRAPQRLVQLADGSADRPVRRRAGNCGRRRTHRVHGGQSQWRTKRPRGQVRRISPRLVLRAYLSRPATRRRTIHAPTGSNEQNPAGSSSAAPWAPRCSQRSRLLPSRRSVVSPGDSRDTRAARCHHRPRAPAGFVRSAVPIAHHGPVARPRALVTSVLPCWLALLLTRVAERRCGTTWRRIAPR